jgi:hypothetical protein
MKIVIMSLFYALSIISLSKAQKATTQNISFGCRYYGGNIDHKKICEMQGYINNNKHAEAVVDKILKPIGLNRNFVVMECPNIDNCFATTMAGIRYVVYDRAFFRKVENSAQTDWAAISILAHEVGHHLQGHTIDGKGSRPDKELEADKFSGFVLHQMGASLAQSQIAMRLLQDETGTFSHPPRKERLKAIEKGWKEADEIYPSQAKKEEVSEKVKEIEPKIEVSKPVIEEKSIEIEVSKTNKTTGCIDGNCETGRGIYVHEQGERYEGTWKESQRHGIGKQFYKDGNIKYEGQFKHGNKEGSGIYYFRNGNRYEGEFMNNLMNGRGTYFYANGDVFVGDFIDDKRNGKGLMVYSDGSQEISYFKNDSKLKRN